MKLGGARQCRDGGCEGPSADGKNVCALPNETPPQRYARYARAALPSHSVSHRVPPCPLRAPAPRPANVTSPADTAERTESGWHGTLLGRSYFQTATSRGAARRYRIGRVSRSTLLAAEHRPHSSPLSPTALSHARFFECRRYSAVQPRGADRFFFLSFSLSPILSLSSRKCMQRTIIVVSAREIRGAERETVDANF